MQQELDVLTLAKNMLEISLCLEDHLPFPSVTVSCFYGGRYQ